MDHRSPKNKYYSKIDGHWVHRTPLKVVINPILRTLQWHTDQPYVVASITKWVDDKPRFIKYVFTRVKMGV